MKKILLLGILVLFAQLTHAQSRQIAFTGWNEYSIDFGNNSGDIKVGKVTNYRNGGRSGTLFIQVWLFNSPYANSSIPGYKIADINLGQLNGGWEFSNLNYPISWNIDVPAGTFYVSFLLVEYNPLPGGNYWVMDYLNFSQRATKSRPETRDDAVVKLAGMIARVNQQQYSEGYINTSIISQRISLNTITIEKREGGKTGKITQKWSNIPWHSLYTVDGYTSTLSGDVIMLSLKFDDLMTYSYDLEGKPEAETRRRDLRQINIYIRRSDHGEAVRLLNLIADSYY